MRLAWRDLIFVLGQLGPRSDGAHTSAEPFEVQVRQALAHVFAILAGSRMRTRSRAAGDSLQRRRRELARL
jgi:enamine deaminase RidA (YjgF/YER057c/UK114 family)